MARPSGVIDINGTDYDVASGRVVGAVKRVAGQVRLPSSAQVIDGFIKNRQSTTTLKPKLAARAAKKVRAKKSSRRAAKVNANAIHRHTEHSKTLMRTRLSRPALKIKEVSQTISSHSADSVRAARAKVVGTHTKVSRFGTPPVDSAPRSQASKVINAVARPLNRAGVSGMSAPSMATGTSHARLERMLDQALMRADAHKQASRRQSWGRFSKLQLLPRWLRITLIVIIILAVAGWFVYRDIPAVAVKVAAERAHVSASLPAYTPSGFRYVAPISYKTGSVTISFKDKASSSSGYSITQQKSDWDSASLAANVIGPKTQVQTSEISGTTVYIYGSSDDATWVNDGVHYTIDNNAGLSSDQVLQIVQSF